MKTYTAHKQLPRHAKYIGSEDGAGFLDETTAFYLEQSINPVRLRESDGTYSYFEVTE